MTSISVRQRINASPETVFQACTDLENLPQVVSGIKAVEVLTGGPVSVGTRFRETRVMFGKEASEVMEFTEIEPPWQFVLESESHGTHYRVDHEIQPVEGGIEFAITFSGEPLNLFAKIMTAMMTPFCKGSLQRYMEADLTDIKNACESADS